MILVFRAILTALIVAALALGLWRLVASVAPQETRGGFGLGAQPPVLVESVAFKPVITRLETVGTSRAKRSASIFPAADGEVRDVQFEAGDYVEEGKLLLALDARAERLAVELAELQMADARRTLERRQELAETGAVTQAALDEAQRMFDEARIALETARVALQDRKIVAPFGGHVGTTDIDPGDRVTSSTEITTLDDRSALLVRFEVPEAFISSLSLGREVDLAPWNDPSDRRRGEIVEIGSRVDPVSRTFQARARVANPGDRLRPGQSFKVVLTLTGRSYPAVPEIAVLWGGDGAYLWAVRDGVAASVPVTIVERRRGEVLVDADLAQDTLVIVEGVQRIREGYEVDIVDPGDGLMTRVTATAANAAP